jgi:hypothetical protein
VNIVATLYLRRTRKPVEFATRGATVSKPEKIAARSTIGSAVLLAAEGVGLRLIEARFSPWAPLVAALIAFPSPSSPCSSLESFLAAPTLICSPRILAWLRTQQPQGCDLVKHFLAGEAPCWVQPCRSSAGSQKGRRPDRMAGLHCQNRGGMVCLSQHHRH